MGLESSTFVFLLQCSTSSQMCYSLLHRERDKEREKARGEMWGQRVKEKGVRGGKNKNISLFLNKLKESLSRLMEGERRGSVNRKRLENPASCLLLWQTEYPIPPSFIHPSFSPVLTFWAQIRASKLTQRVHLCSKLVSNYDVWRFFSWFFHSALLLINFHYPKNLGYVFQITLLSINPLDHTLVSIQL